MASPVNTLLFTQAGLWKDKVTGPYKPQLVSLIKIKLNCHLYVFVLSVGVLKIKNNESGLSRTQLEISSWILSKIASMITNWQTPFIIY